MSGPFSILFVDDQAEILQVITRTLAGTSLEILTADSGEAALRTLRDRHVDVMVSDIEMPGMSGIELLKSVRAEHPRTLRMLLTGAATLERAVSAINEGEVARLFRKPFDPVLFRASIEALTERIGKMRLDDDEQSASARHLEFNRWVDRHYPGLREVTWDAERRVILDEHALVSELRASGQEALWKELFG